MASDDNELRRQLKQLGVDVGPITDTTRGLYQRMLQKKSRVSAKFPRNSSSNNSTSGIIVNRSGHATKVSSIIGSREQAIKNIGSVRSPGSHLRGTTIASQRNSHTGKRAASRVSYEVEPKRPRLEVYDKSSSSFDSEEGVESSGAPTNTPLAVSHAQYPRLYPTLPEDVDGEPTASPEQSPQVLKKMPPGSPTVQHKKQPFPNSNEFKSPTKPLPENYSKFSPPSPSPSEDSSAGGGLVSIVTGFIGAGVRKLVNQIASPRPPIRRKRSGKRVSFGSPRNSPSDIPVVAPHSGPSPGPVNDPVPIGEVELGELSPPVSPLCEPGTAEPEDRDGYDWELLPSDVEICKKADGSLWRLGKGGFGEVFKGLKDSVDEVAVKVIRIQNSPGAVDQFKREIDIISKLRHRHILQFYGACIQPSCLYMVTELMQTDLFSTLRHDIRYLWTGIYGREVLLGVASGLHYLHSRRPPVVHRDIKSPNILLMDGIAKIADVGIARTKSDSDMTAQKGYTIAWAAPEVVYRKRATEKIDIWSFGVIVWEVVSGKMPRVGHLVLPPQAPPLLHTLYTSCVAEDPGQRPSATEVVKQLKTIA